MIPLRAVSDDAAGRPQRALILLALTAVTAGAWTYLLLGGGMGPDAMDMGDGSVMTMMPQWTPGYAALVLVMWIVMMAAMMLPSAAPALLKIAAAARAPAGGGIAPALCFAGGYLVVWAGVSAALTAAQWALDAGHLLTESMAIANPPIAGGLVAAIGLYQLTPLKQRLLEHCRATDDCVAEERRPTARATVRRGLRYGVACVGCCSPMMCLLFVGGLMNVAWPAAISLWVVAEKTLPFGSGIARLGGAGLLLWAAVPVAQALY